MAIVTLLTDFGLRDYYVGAVKGTLLRLVPAAQLIDLSHEVAPGDVEGGAFLLAAACRCFPSGTVHLAVVDPGVGSQRRLLVAGDRDYWFVAPDNGLLDGVLDGASVRSVTATDLFVPAPGQTFHGRDRCAPIAAFLAGGGDPAALGPLVDDPVRLAIEAPRRRGKSILGRIRHIDGYGNLVTDIPAAWLPTSGTVAEVDTHRVELSVSHYAELPVGVPGILVGSLGTFELSLRGENLARRWQVDRGAAVEFRQGPLEPLDAKR